MFDFDEDPNFKCDEASNNPSFLELLSARIPNPGSKLQGDECGGRKGRWMGEEEDE